MSRGDCSRPKSSWNRSCWQWCLESYPSYHPILSLISSHLIPHIAARLYHQLDCIISSIVSSARLDHQLDWIISLISQLISQLDCSLEPIEEAITHLTHFCIPTLPTLPAECAMCTVRAIRATCSISILGFLAGANIFPPLDCGPGCYQQGVVIPRLYQTFVPTLNQNKTKPSCQSYFDVGAAWAASDMIPLPFLMPAQEAPSCGLYGASTTMSHAACGMYHKLKSPTVYDINLYSPAPGPCPAPGTSKRMLLDDKRFRDHPDKYQIGKGNGKRGKVSVLKMVHFLMNSCHEEGVATGIELNGAADPMLTLFFLNADPARIAGSAELDSGSEHLLVT
eukprot:gene27009-biopygen803